MSVLSLTASFVPMPAKPPRPWTDERILAALRAWTAAMGKPPRSYEWSPATARSLDLYNERTARWERDWPRWPSADTLRYHFGRFNQALKAAGFAARPLVFELALPERVEAARRLAAAGEPTVAIADHLGVHPETVRNYLRARSCRDCGTAVVSSAERCLRCALGRQRKHAWTPAEIVEALRAWTTETGAPPTTSEWDSGERAAPKWLRQRERWPTAQLVRSRFGSWDAALRAAGYRARWRGHTPDELTAALTREAGRLGRPPTQHEWATGSPHRPNASSVARAFGSWAAGLRAAGLVPPSRRRWSDGEVLEALRVDRPPWPGAALAGLEARRTRPPHRRARAGPLRLLALGARGRRRRARATGVDPGEGAGGDPGAHRPPRSPTAQLGVASTHGDEIPPTHVVINRFGSWRAAMAAAETGRPASEGRPGRAGA